MKVLAVGRPLPGVDAAAEIPRLADAELTELWRLYAEGTVREMYSPGGPGAVLILETSDLARAEQALAGLPLVAEHVIAFELTELRPFAALSRLFAG